MQRIIYILILCIVASCNSEVKPIPEQKKIAVKQEPEAAIANNENTFAITASKDINTAYQTLSKQDYNVICNEMEDVLGYLNTLYDYKKNIDDASKYDSLSNKCRQTSELLRKYAKNIFPKLRKSYCEISARKVWEDNVYITCSGEGNRIINFTGGIFANNKNIQQMHDMFSANGEKLRFKQDRYRWYKDASEYTYFTISNVKDDDITHLKDN